MTAPQWQERSREAAVTRVNVAREREAAAAEQRYSDAEANAAGEPGGYGRPEPDQTSQGAKTSKTTGTKAK